VVGGAPGLLLGTIVGSGGGVPSTTDGGGGGVTGCSTFRED